MADSLVVITGAAGALGRGVAQAFINAGHRVVLVDRDAAALRAVYSGEKAGQYLVAVDLTSREATQKALGDCFAQHGVPAVLCNIAGGFAMGDAVHEAGEEVWQQMLEMNVNTVLNTSYAVVPGMLASGGGKVINVAAAGAVSGKPAMAPYCVSKSAVARITESMALELRDKGINVNAVAPSIIDTPSNRAGMPDADPALWVSPEQLANVILFLASEQASAVHGAVIPVVGRS
ncbi:3-oxoacyl-ACP reductase [Pseudomonas sp. WN033]|nr:3-oxoacyl-ACP reductase [Pseudomonas sp. WN033]